MPIDVVSAPWFGGPAVGVSGAEMLEYLDLELAIRGDGEGAIVELLARLGSGRPLDGMAGLVRRVDGRVVQDNLPAGVADLDSLPMNRVYDLLDVEAYRPYGAHLQVQTKRGCALACSYCTYNRIEGRSWRLRDPQKVADDIELLVKQTGLTSVEFTDSTFNFPIRHCKAVLRAIIAKKLKLTLRTMGLNPGAVDEELAGLLKEAGFREVDLGVEAGCDETLKGLGKSFRTPQVLTAGRLLREQGIPVTWYLLMGGPNETEETVRKTLATVAEAASPWDLVNFGIGLRVYRDSPIATQMQREDPGCTRDNFLSPVTFRPKGLSIEKLKALVKREALTRSNYFMYDEDETTPLLVQAVGNFVIRHFAPNQPLFRVFILLRLVQRVTGVNAVRRVVHALRSSALLGRVRGVGRALRARAQAPSLVSTSEPAHLLSGERSR